MVGLGRRLAVPWPVPQARPLHFIAVMALIGVAGSASDASADGRRKLDRALRQVVDSSQDGPTYQVIVRAKPGADARLRQQLSEENKHVVAEHPAIGAVT